MKVCLVAGVISTVLALMSWARRNRSRVLQVNTSEKIISIWPIWGLLSVVLLPFAPLVGAIAVLMAQALLNQPESFTLSDCSLISRIGVLVMLAWIAAGTIPGIMAVLKRERPRLLGALGVMMNALLIGLFWYLKFYQLGFDQDRWAAP